jgi:hypothetical protein
VNEIEHGSNVRELLYPNRPVPRQTAAAEHARGCLEKSSPLGFASRLTTEIARALHAREDGPDESLCTPVVRLVFSMLTQLSGVNFIIAGQFRRWLYRGRSSDR